MNRITNLILAWILLIFLLVPIGVIALLVKLTSAGPAIHWSRRVGRHSILFMMPKFRTMRTDAPDLPTHLFQDPARFVTPLGRFLRKTSLDELPQLWSIIKGDMAFVGPRPALHNQDDLVALRQEKGIDQLMPGVTGWAQVMGRDELSIPDKVKMESYYLEHRSLIFDLKIIGLTVFAVFKPKGVSH